jgi:uncharacterized heparinase superfamily protein
VSEGRFVFVGITRELGEQPFPAPPDAPLLWAYHLEYMDYLLDLGLEGRRGRLGDLVRKRLETERKARASATHPYPLSRRTAAWLRAMPHAPTEVREEMAAAAWTWAHRVLANLEHDVGGNHLLENGLALALAGAAFRGPRASRLLAAGRRILVTGARDQVLADGAHYELSPMYHARVLAVLLEGGIALEGAGARLSPEYWPTVARMTAFLRDVLDPDGELPLIGDSARDAGFEADRFLPAVSAAVPVPLPPPVRGDRHLPDSGLVFLEDPDEGNRLLLDAGPVCPDRLPAHGQADTFSFTLHLDGAEVICDAGVHEYAAGPMRDWCRSTRAHSTVTVDDEDSSEVWASFRVGRRARVRDARFVLSGDLGTFSASHDGYARRGVRHHRMAAHLAPGIWLIADRLAGRGDHVYRSRLHLHPGVVTVDAGSRGMTFSRRGQTLSVAPFGVDGIAWEDGWYCPRFGERRESRLLRMDAGGGSRVFGYVLSARGPASAEVDGGTVRARVGDLRFTRAVP